MSDIVTRHHYDQLEDRDIVERVQDCEPIVKEVKQIKEVTDGRSNNGIGYFAGRIPGVIVEQYCNENKVSFRDFCIDDTHIKRILNNPDYKKFRVFEGKV